MKDVVYDKGWLKTTPNLELYYMYRGVEKKDGLKHSITVIPAIMLGEEFNKTQGHEHLPENYGEVYIVLEGEAIFLMQKRNGDEIEDVYAIKAKKGDVAIIPPFYGHFTINPSNKELKTGDWTSENRKNNYQPVLEKQGACYFYTKNGWIKNKNYKKIPELRFEKPLKSIPKNLDFLKG